MEEDEEDEDDWEDEPLSLEEQGEKLRATVGECIHEWCRLEDALVGVLSWALNVPHRKAGVIFSTVASFAVKLDFIDVLCSEELEDKPELEFWKSAVINLRMLASARNVLAHHSPITRADLDYEDPTKWQPVIQPNSYDARRRARRRGYTRSDTSMLAWYMRRMERQLTDFVYHLDGTQESARQFCKAMEKLEPPDELKGKPMPEGKKRKRETVRRKPQPGKWIGPDVTTEQLAEIIAKMVED